MKFYAFRKRDGSIRVRGYYETTIGVDPELEKLYDDIFCDEILNPFDAIDLEDAKHKAKDKLKTKGICSYHNLNVRNKILD
jgi:hypothetical protein